MKSQIILNHDGVIEYSDNYIEDLMEDIIRDIVRTPRILGGVIKCKGNYLKFEPAIKIDCITNCIARSRYSCEYICGRGVA